MPVLPLPPAHLVPVLVEGRSLYVPLVGDGDHHFLFLDHVLEGYLGDVVGDLRQALVSVPVAHLDKFLFHDVDKEGLVGQNPPQSVDFVGRVLVVVEYLRPLQGGQSLEPHLEDVCCLLLGEGKPRDEGLAGRGRIGGTLMMAITSSMWSRAVLRPSRRCSLSMALLSSNVDLFVTISLRNSTNSWSILSD